MGCDSPISAYRSKDVNPKTGKRPLVFKAQGSFSGLRMDIPCGRCLGCRLEHSRQWAVRMMHENKMHPVSEFVTLTYDNEHLPPVGTLVPKHLQDFHKRLHNRLRDARGYGIRYYGCGEYGDENKRPHYHSILYGVWFPDRKIYSYSNGKPIYTSKKLDEIWGMGSCKIAAVEFDTCAYVARYVTKKVSGERREQGHYVVYDADGVIHEREPEFSHMSMRPGIGSTYVDKYYKELLRSDSVIMNGHEVPMTRYYDMKLEKLDPARMAVIKTNRRRKAAFNRRIDMEAERADKKMRSRKRTKEVLKLKLFQMKKRNL